MHENAPLGLQTPMGRRRADERPKSSYGPPDSPRYPINKMFFGLDRGSQCLAFPPILGATGYVASKILIFKVEGIFFL